MKNKVKLRKKKFAPQQIQELLQLWKGSGKTKKRFAEEHGLKYYTLMEWFRRYEGSRESAFQELKLPARDGVFAEFEKGPLVVRFYQPFPADYFSYLIG